MSAATLGAELAADLATVAAEIPAESPAESHPARLPLAVIDPSPDNPREDVGDVDELAQSIRESGGRLLQRLVVVPAALYRAAADQLPDPADEGRYIVIAGHRRRAACLQLGLEYVDCDVRTDLVGPAAQIAMLVENLQRVDLAALEEAHAFDRLKDLGLKQRDIADRVGRSQAHISKRLSLLKLPPTAQAAVIGGEVSLADAAAVAVLAGNGTDQFERAWRIVERGGYWTGKRAVDEVVEADKRAAKVAAERSRLSGQGVHVVDDRPESWNITARTKVARLDAFVAKPRNHKKLPCHAAYVDPHTSAVLECCTDPGQHLKATESAADAAKAAEKAAAKAGQAAATDRLRALSRAVRKVTPEQRANLLHDFVILAATNLYATDARPLAGTARRILGTDIDDDGNLRNAVGVSDQSALVEETIGLPDDLVATSIALARLELACDVKRGRWPGLGWYFDLLVEHGHQLHDIEHERLGHVRTSAGAWTTAAAP